MKHILLPNRYKLFNYLEYVSRNLYRLELDENSAKWMTVTCASGHEWEDHEYFAVDPSGGPFLSVGSGIEHKKIIRITGELEDGNIVYYIHTKTIYSKLFSYYKNKLINFLKNL